jgi:ATP-dependent Clp protease adaptor protein ClpS
MPRAGLKARREEKAADSDSSAHGWKAVLFNCDCHTFHEVAIQLVKAIDCTYARGKQLANVVHHTGCAVVYSGSRERCETVASVLGEVGLKAKAES